MENEMEVDFILCVDCISKTLHKNHNIKNV